MAMGGVRILFLAAAAIACIGAAAGGLRAQEGPGGYLNPGRDCQTITTCRFTKGGSYRGCLSSYSCRVCKFVPARCSIGGAKGTCRQVRCVWGA
jgi:hypothetical protein